MANQVVENVQTRFESTVDMVTGTVHKFFLVGLGAASMVQENIMHLIENGESFANKLVEKGETTEKDGVKMFNEFVEPYQNEVKDRVKEVEKQFNDLSESILNRFNVPSAGNIEELNKKVTSLGRKVDQLKKA
jgi:poly(hydroxyalkanoate) granule-associated protein